MSEKDNSGQKWTALAAGALLIVILIATIFLWGPVRARWASGKAKLAGVFKAPPAEAVPAVSGEPRILYYEDPMHRWYRSDKPGIAPDCGMKLVPVYAEGNATGAAMTPGAVQISPARQQLMGVTTAKAEYRPLERVIRAVGRVEIDETRVANVHVKVNGWIQKVFVDYTFQHVKKGDPLFTIYSPDLLATEQEYVLALKARQSLSNSSYPEVAAGGLSLLEAARRRLALWDLTDAQIRQLDEGGPPQREITFYSPATGHVLERKAFPNQYVTPETELYKLADHTAVWVLASIYESELPLVGLGQEATLTAEALPGQAIKGRVSYIQPHLMEETRTLPVRMEFPNPDLKLKPGMFVNVEVKRSLGRPLTVPVDALLDSGLRQVVFVDRGDNYFEPRNVKVGDRTENYVSVLGGLRAGESVVTRANFLIDSESNLREAAAGMAGMPGMQPETSSPGAAEAPVKPAPPKPSVKQHQH